MKIIFTIDYVTSLHPTPRPSQVRFAPVIYEHTPFSCRLFLTSSTKPEAQCIATRWAREGPSHGHGQRSEVWRCGPAHG